MAQDRIIIQVRYKKLIFKCPSCGNEDIVDANVGGGNTYETNCSQCGTWTNKFTNFDDIINYSQEEYDKVKEEELIQAKTEKVNAFIYAQKNPPPYVEPSKEDYLNMYNDKMNEISQYLQVLGEKATKEDLEVIKASLDTKVSEVESKISEKAVTPIKETELGVIK